MGVGGGCGRVVGVGWCGLPVLVGGGGWWVVVGGGGGGVESKFSVQLWSKPKLCPWT